MAYVEVDPGPMPESGKFVKFAAVGDKHGGIFVSHETAMNKFDKEEHRYTFKNKEGLFTITANYDLNRRLQKAQLQPGHAVIMTYVSDLPSKTEGYSPMKMFKVVVDTDPKKPAPKAPVVDDNEPF